MTRLQLHTGSLTLPFCVDFDLLLPECPYDADPADYYTGDNRLPVLFLLHGGGALAALRRWLRRRTWPWSAPRCRTRTIPTCTAAIPGWTG